MPILYILACLSVLARTFQEVADSLVRRVSLGVVGAVLLYVSYGLEAASAGVKGTHVVTYDQLTSDWLACTDKIALHHKCVWPRTDVRMRVEIDEFLSPAKPSKRSLRIPSVLSRSVERRVGQER